MDCVVGNVCTTSRVSSSKPCSGFSQENVGPVSVCSLSCNGNKGGVRLRLRNQRLGVVEQTRSGRRRGAGVGVRCSLSGNSMQFVALHQLSEWLSKQGFPSQDVKLTSFGEEGIGLAAGRDLKAGETALNIPENYTVTGVDVVNHPVIAAAAAGRGDLIGLTLWLMYERSRGESSIWHPYLQTFPLTTLSPLLWSVEEQQELLKGSPVLGRLSTPSLFDVCVSYRLL